MAALQITDVTMRDGLQMQSKILSVPEKLLLLEKLLACGYSRLEVTSFVNPKWVPQFTDADDFCKAIFEKWKSPPVELMAFVPNEKGLDRLLAHPINWVSAFIATSETFNQKNVNQPIADTVTSLKAVVKKAHENKRKARIYISTVFGCPYEKQIASVQLDKVFKAVADLGADEVALSDTIGVATPTQTKEVIEQFSRVYPKERTAIHLHHTYGTSLACAQAAFDSGIRQMDGSTGGLGGCPYAKGASGNTPTEELLYLFFRQGQAKFSWEAIKAVLETAKDNLGLAVSSKLFEIHQKGGSLYGIGQ